VASGMVRSVVDKMDAVMDGRTGQSNIAVSPVSR
jgi:hypothetical protein